ncbi:GspH/FimT family pseudopilin [Photobacterium sp. DA100]|uniref:pilus assembly FimT family protein n=1 Tax=Photobacterium sp. DA100 TaxID=3027472 RepID=UPI0024784F26|nr:GspH/FimT family pseudopilin [Photobacterium sp. DA100]WEM41804.1 GspH/FimT family pseudopilin [Photobacterium sp. DA100]
MTHIGVSQIKQQRRQRSNRVAGFTLIELVIAIAVLAILAAATAPSFQTLLERNRVVRLAEELQGLLMQAKSEAVIRNEELNLELVRDDGNDVTSYHSDGEWVLALLPSAVSGASISDTVGNAYSVLQGNGFKQVYVKANYSTTVTVSPIRGTSNLHITYQFYASDPAQSVEVKMNRMTGRIYICSDSGAYGYGVC